jgi:hypothetical protein
MNFRGTGPIRRKMRTRGFIKSFLDIWETFYLSLDGSALHLYDNRTDPEPILSLELNQIKALQIELFSHHSATFESNGKKKFSSIEDRYMMVLRTHGWDVVRIQYVLVLLPLSFFSSLLSSFSSLLITRIVSQRQELERLGFGQSCKRFIATLPDCLDLQSHPTPSKGEKIQTPINFSCSILCISS